MIPKFQHDTYIIIGFHTPSVLHLLISYAGFRRLFSVEPLARHRTVYWMEGLASFCWQAYSLGCAGSHMYVVLFLFVHNTSIFERVSTVSCDEHLSRLAFCTRIVIWISQFWSQKRNDCEYPRSNKKFVSETVMRVVRISEVWRDLSRWRSVHQQAWLRRDCVHSSNIMLHFV